MPAPINAQLTVGDPASSTPTSSLTWISWFCSLPGHEYFCEVSEDFIEDDFNLTGLNSLVPFWKEAMEMVLDVEPEEDSLKIPDVSIVEASAELLYGLVHQRYILTRAGLHAMAEKYEAGQFGTCPRVYCQACHVVPCGRSDLPGLDTVKLYCPNCHDIYSPPSSRFQGVDGAFFGTTFAHLFFQTYREFAPAPFYSPSGSSSTNNVRSPAGTPSGSAIQVTGQQQQQQSQSQSQAQAFVNPNQHGGQKPAAGKVYTPRIYGFRVSERAKSGPRMRWLRVRPESPSELDHVDWRGRWIGSDDDEYEDEEEEEGGVLEDFDPDTVEGEEDEEEEEEEEEDGGGRGAGQHVAGPGRRQYAAHSSLRPPTPINGTSSPRNAGLSSGASSVIGPRTPRHDSFSQATSSPVGAPPSSVVTSPSLSPGYKQSTPREYATQKLDPKARVMRSMIPTDHWPRPSPA